MDINTHILIYKQTALPLVEYVSFMMCFNSKQDIEKFQRLQNKSLRLCYNINNAVDINTTVLHENAKMEKLCDRRTVSLSCIMYDLYQQGMYERNVTRVTRAANGFTFDLMVPRMSVYAKSPYYVGANVWNLLPTDIRNTDSKDEFKQKMRDHLKH